MAHFCVSVHLLLDCFLWANAGFEDQIRRSKSSGLAVFKQNHTPSTSLLFNDFTTPAGVFSKLYLASQRKGRRWLKRFVIFEMSVCGDQQLFNWGEISTPLEVLFCQFIFEEHIKSDCRQVSNFGAR